MIVARTFVKSISFVLFSLSLIPVQATKRTDDDLPKPDFALTKKAKTYESTAEESTSFMEEYAIKHRMAQVHYEKAMDEFMAAQSIEKASQSAQMLLTLQQEPFLSAEQKTTIGYLVATIKVNYPHEYRIISDLDARNYLKNAYENPSDSIREMKAGAGLFLGRMFMEGRVSDLSVDNIIDILNDICSSTTEHRIISQVSIMLLSLQLRQMRH